LLIRRRDRQGRTGLEEFLTENVLTTTQGG
jgi:hypothetical protein